MQQVVVMEIVVVNKDSENSRGNNKVCPIFYFLVSISFFCFCVFLLFSFFRFSFTSRRQNGLAYTCRK